MYVCLLSSFVSLFRRCKKVYVFLLKYVLSIHMYIVYTKLKLCLHYICFTSNLVHGSVFIFAHTYFNLDYYLCFGSNVLYPPNLPTSRPNPLEKKKVIIVVRTLLLLCILECPKNDTRLKTNLPPLPPCCAHEKFSFAKLGTI